MDHAGNRIRRKRIKIRVGREKYFAGMVEDIRQLEGVCIGHITRDSLIDLRRDIAGSAWEPGKRSADAQGCPGHER
jgi:hypothetical protein